MIKQGSLAIAVALLLLAGAFTSACSSDDESPTTHPPPADDASVPSTPGPAEGVGGELSTSPNAMALIAELASGDVDAVIARIEWALMPCQLEGEGRGSVESCPINVTPGTQIAVVDVGAGGFQFWVTEATLRSTLDIVLAGGLPLKYAARETATQQLFLGFDGAAKGKGLLPISSPDVELVGLFIRYDDQVGTIKEIATIGGPATAVGLGWQVAQEIPQDVIASAE